MYIFEKKAGLVTILFLSMTLLSCNGSGEQKKTSPAVTAKMTEPSSEVTAKAEEKDDMPSTKANGWKKYEEGKYYSLYDMKYKNDLFCKCSVKDDTGKVLYEDVFHEAPGTLSATEKDSIIDVHYGYGTQAFMDKFIDVKKKEQTDWLDNIWGAGETHVAYIRGDWKDGTNTKIIIDNKFGRSAKKKLRFPHVCNEAEADVCEFRKHDKELYLHYIDKDTKKEAEVTIPLTEFK